MNYKEQEYWPVSHMIVIALVPIAFMIMLFEASRSIDLEGASLPILMVTCTLASIQWEIRTRRRQGEDI